MTEASNYWDKRAIKRLRQAEKTSDKYIKRIKKMYNQAYKNIDKEIAKVYKNYSKETGLDVQKLKELLTKSETKKTWEELKQQGLDEYIKDNYKSRISRLEQIQAQIYAKSKLIYPKEELENTMCYKGVINNSYYKAVYDTQIGIGYDFAFNKIDKNLINVLLNEKWSGKNYSERIWKNTNILAESVSEIIGGALLSGQSISKTSKQIQDRFDVGKYYAERLVRTETNHFNNEADAMAYKEMGVKEYVFVAVLDSRTSETCQDHDNKVYKYKEREVGVNFPPLHPNCRSTTRGYLGEEAEKMLKRRARNPITGKNEIIDNMSYSEWGKLYTNPLDEQNDKKADDEKVVDIKSLTKNQKEAVEQYVSGEGMWINQYLRGRGDFGEITESEKAYLENLRAGTNNELGESMTLYRSVDASSIFGNISDIDYENLVNRIVYNDNQRIILNSTDKYLNNIVGKEFIEKGFMSTSSSLELTKEFGDFTGSDKPIILELKTPKNVKGINLSKEMPELEEIMQQKEVLLQDGVKYKITGIEGKDGNIYVKADIIAEPVKENIKEPAKTVSYKKLFKDELMANIKSKYIGNNKKVVTAFENATIDDEANKIIGNLSKLDEVTVTNGRKSYFTPHDKNISISGNKDGTVYHEWGHSIDYMYSKKMADSDNFKWISESIEDIRLSMNKDLDNTIPKDLIDIFTREQDRVIEDIKADMKKNSKELGERIYKIISKKYGNNYNTASEDIKKIIFEDVYNKEATKIIKTALENDINYSKWGALSDIYDAITNGMARNSSSLIYAHGYDYYHDFSITIIGTGSSNKQNAEIFADFIEIKLGNYTEQLDYLQKNAPLLYNKLEEIYKQIGDDLCKL